MLKFDPPADWTVEWADFLFDQFGPLFPSARHYADGLIREGLAPEADRRILEARLEVAALRYFEGRATDYWIKQQSVPEYRSQFEDARGSYAMLKRLGRGHPPQRCDHWFIREMARIWRALGHRPTTAYKRKTTVARGEEHETRFVQFCLYWMQKIDPERRHLPKKTTFVRALRDLN